MFKIIKENAGRSVEMRSFPTLAEAEKAAVPLKEKHSLLHILYVPNKEK